MGIYLHSQDTTLPFVVGILLLGAVISLSAGADGATVMYLTMAFAGGGCWRLLTWEVIIMKDDMN